VAVRKQAEGRVNVFDYVTERYQVKGLPEIERDIIDV